ncbi:rod shape-determining protein MreC, partial [Candidatus Dojkabacteria bacterium]|nr:rod shape-determining protein MreC [Candidatus Dojkabacteria bacterium]
YNFFSNFREELDFLGSFSTIRDERDQLLEDNIVLQMQLAEAKKENEALVALQRQEQFDLPYELIPVRVIRSNEQEIGEVILNKGVDQGVIVGDIVVYDNYAVGEVIEVIGNISRVRLLTSPESIVPVISLDNGTKGIVEGDVTLGLRLDEIVIEDEVLEGEVIITSGVNSNYPYGLIAGRVGEIFVVESEVTKSAKLDTNIEYGNLDKLYIIKST